MTGFGLGSTTRSKTFLPACIGLMFATVRRSRQFCGSHTPQKRCVVAEMEND